MAYQSSEYGAKCSSFKQMEFDGEVIEYPYKCDPSDQEKLCSLMFDIDPADEAFTLEDPTTQTRSKVQNRCRCSLDGEATSGYCSSMLGTEKYARAAAAMLIVKEESGCHSQDRFSLRAQKDPCGIGVKSD